MGLKLEDHKPITGILRRTPGYRRRCPVVALSAESRRVDARNGHRHGRDYMYDNMRRSKTMQLNHNPKAVGAFAL